MEDERNDADTPGVTRGQNQLHVLPEDWSVAATVIAPLLDRIDATAAATQLLIVTSDADAAEGILRRLASAAPSTVTLLAATDARRATRVLKAVPPQVLAGAPRVLLEQLQGAVLKLDAVHAVALAWVEDLDSAASRALETLMTDLPKDATRYVLAGGATPATDALVERYARRARRPPVGEVEAPVTLSYVATSDAARPAALRRLLDAADARTAAIVVRSEPARTDVQGQLRALGYADSKDVRIVAENAGDAELVVLYELPTSDAELRRLARSTGATRVVALVASRQIPTLRRFAGGAVAPFVLPAAAERARAADATIRDELRELLASGLYARELLALEPLLSEYDGAEVAAAALRLLETERGKPRAKAADAGAGAMTRLHVNIGEMDAVRPGDLVGAITNQAGITSAELGRVDIRERHSTVEVASAVAETVVAKVTGISIKGRRAVVKVDEGRERRDTGDRRQRSDRSDRPDRRDRPTRPRPPRR